MLNGIFAVVGLAGGIIGLTAKDGKDGKDGKAVTNGAPQSLDEETARRIFARLLNLEREIEKLERKTVHLEPLDIPLLKKEIRKLKNNLTEPFNSFFETLKVDSRLKKLKKD